MFSFAQTFPMDKIFYLASCDTCRKIIKSLPNQDRLTFRDIKQTPVSAAELEEMRTLSGSYEALFSKKAHLYKSLGLKDKTLTENDFKKYLLEHYTFLSRPVLIVQEKIFIGNSQKNVSNAIAALS